MSKELFQLLQAANREFPRFLTLAATLVDNPEGSKEVQAVLNRLQQIGEQFAAAPPGQPPHPAMQTALAEYRKNLEKLLPAMLGLRSSLLARRAQLEARSSHLRAACLWAASLDETI